MEKFRDTEKDITTGWGIRIPSSLVAEVYNHLKNLKINKSEFIREAIEEKLINEDKDLLEEEIKHYENTLVLLRKRRDNFVAKESDFKKISQKEIKFLLETKIILDRDPTYVRGRINLYKNTFRKIYRISEDDFWKLIFEAENQSKEKIIIKELEILT